MCMKLYSKNDNNFVVGYGDNQVSLTKSKILFMSSLQYLLMETTRSLLLSLGLFIHVIFTILVDGDNQVSLTKSMIIYSCHLCNTCCWGQPGLSY